MTGIGDNSHKEAREQLCSIVERIERLEEEIRAMNDDKKEVYAEAKSVGFDTKVLKKVIADRRKDWSERQEFDAIYDLYAHALGMLPDGDFSGNSSMISHAHVQAHEVDGG